MVLEGENPTSMAKTTGLGVVELSNVFYRLQPDVVITIADRYETIATSIASAYQNIPLAHIQGGEVTGNIDEKVRHANTKLADLHFVASENAKRRVIKLGENPECVFNTGCPSIDLANEIIQRPTLDFNIYQKYGGVGAKPALSTGYLVVMQHPVTTEHNKSREHIEETLHAINDLNIPTLWFWPNIDAGADGTSSGIRAFREHHECPHIHFFKNMEPEDFLKLLYNAKCLVGNSSVGLRECSFMGVPVVNIGTRQNRRDRGSNVIDVFYNRGEIIKEVRRWLTSPRPKSDDLYGSGNAGELIARHLSELTLSHHKTIRY